jgi:hypothetical protein
MLNMKRISILICALFLLTACGNSDTEVTTDGAGIETVGKIPATCELAAVNSAFAEIIPPSKYIPTEWTPAEGTDLAAALNSGGIACSYGDADAEVGGTVIWAPSSAWTEREEVWKSEGMEEIDIPNIDETAAYKLPDGSTSADGMPAWRVNLLINGVWIQLGAAFIQSFDEASPIIQTAIDATK